MYIDTIEKMQMSSNNEHIFEEDSTYNISLALKSGSEFASFRVYKDGNLLGIDGIHYQYTVGINVHTLTLNSVQMRDSGVFQMELHNLAGAVVEYNYVTVKCECGKFSVYKMI